MSYGYRGFYFFVISFIKGGYSMDCFFRKKTNAVKKEDMAKIEFPEPDEEIIITETTGRNKRKIKGTVLKNYDTFISVKLEGKEITESFLKVDFLTGDLKLI